MLGSEQVWPRVGADTSPHMRKSCTFCQFVGSRQTQSQSDEYRAVILVVSSVCGEHLTATVPADVHGL
jgi:hypothetical protein